MKMSKLVPTQQKLRGGYYTPIDIANFLTTWTIRSKNDTVLEPSSGDGIFIEPIFKRLKDLGTPKSKIVSNVYAVEIEKTEYQKTKNKLRILSNSNISNQNIINDDFFSVFSKQFKNQKFDAIIGNPPFIRYQNFDEDVRERALQIVKDAGLKGSKLTNIWVPFLVASSLLLSKKGRLGMIIPAELLQVNYTADLRLFLSEFFSFITIVTFKKLLFPNIQQEVVLFLGEKVNGTHGINIVELEDETHLADYLSNSKGKESFKPINHTSDKWTQYFLSNKEILLLRKLKNHQKLTQLGSLADVNVGVVTGKNEFFVVNDDVVKQYSMSSNVLPIVPRTAQIKGLIFTKRDWKQNKEDGLNCQLFYPSKKYTLNKKIRTYIKEGEKNKIHFGYKCSIRDPWYVVPTIWSPDAFFSRQINGNPKMILNQTTATVTDTIHRVKCKEKVDVNSLVVSFHNSLTFAFSEILGRSYGGGVLELEPTEAEELPIPYFKCNKKTLSKIDEMVRRKESMEKILKITDELLLKKQLKLSDKEIQTLQKIWKKLSLRRINRKYSN